MSLARRRRLMSNLANDPDILWLYKEGDECVSTTGGWVKLWNFGASASTIIFEKNEKEFYVEASNNTNGGNGGCISVNKIDLTNFTNFVVEFTRLKNRSNYTPYTVTGSISLMRDYVSGSLKRGDSLGRTIQNDTGPHLMSPVSNDGTLPLNEELIFEIPSNCRVNNRYVTLFASPVKGGFGISKLGLITF